MLLRFTVLKTMAVYLREKADIFRYAELNYGADLSPLHFFLWKPDSALDLGKYIQNNKNKAGIALPFYGIWWYNENAILWQSIWLPEYRLGGNLLWLHRNFT